MDRKIVNRWARLATVVVAMLALVVVVAPGVANLDLGDPYRTRQQVTEKVTIGPTGGRTTERTTSPAKLGLLEQSLAPGGLLLLRLAVAAAAAFLAGAVVQRILLGEFAFKAGGVELGPVAAVEVTDAVDTAIQALRAKDQDQQNLIEGITVSLAAIVRGLSETSGE